MSMILKLQADGYSKQYVEREGSSGAELLGMHTESVTLQLFEGRLFINPLSTSGGREALAAPEDGERDGEGGRGSAGCVYSSCQVSQRITQGEQGS